MIGIKDIGVYIPQARNNNFDMVDRYKIEPNFITEKIGIHQTSRMAENEQASAMCVKAFHDLQLNHPEIAEKIDCLTVCTQNGDYNIPHTSAIVHGKLDLPQQCAAFDISLGCSGYVYSLHVMKSFMEENDLKHGLLFTSDPYSLILDESDKNTNLLFGDGATVTLLTTDPVYQIEKGIFESCGKSFQALIKRPDKYLFMNGREIYNFVMQNIPKFIDKCLTKNQIPSDNIDYFLLHQASKYMIDRLISTLQYEPKKVPFSIQDFGNTVSSSIPILLKEYGLSANANNLLLCGFGVGLSMAATVIRRV